MKKLLELIKNELNKVLNVDIETKNEYTLFFDVENFYVEVRNISRLLILDISSSHLVESFEEEEIIEIDNYIEDLNDCFKKGKEKNIYRGVDFIDNNLFFFFRCDEILYEMDNNLILNELTLFNYIANNIALKKHEIIDKTTIKDRR